MADCPTCPQSKNHYGFYGRLKSEFPSQVIIDVTEICNLACIHCPHPEFKKSSYYSASSLDPELNKKMIDEIREDGKGHVQYVRYTSEGEPLVHPKVFEMLKYAKDNSGTLVSLTTNGKRLFEAQTEKLLESGVDMVDISIDAFKEETYAKIRVGGELKVTRANVLNLLRRKRETGSHLKVVVSYIEQPQNKTETEDFTRFWKESGADYVVVRKLHSAAGAKEDISKGMWNSVAQGERRPCVYPWERIVLNPRGFISFCPADWTHGSTVTDFRKVTIKEVWSGEFYRKLREAHLTNEYSKHQFCGKCPDWAVTSWPGEGRGYAEMVEEFKREGSNTLVNP